MTTGTYAAWRSGWRPEHIALVCGDARLTYGSLHERVRAATGWLVGHGVRPGDTVALCMAKEPDQIVLLLAAMRLGAVALPLNDRYTPRELGLPLADAPASLVVAPDPLCAAVSGPWRVVPASSVSPGIDAASPVDPPDPGPDAVQLLLYTSGTTGRAKGVPLRARQVAATVEALHAAWGWSADDVLLHALPTYHVHGLVVAAYGALRAGATQRWSGPFDAATAVDAMASGSVTVFMGVPTFWARIASLPDDGVARDLSGVRLATSGSAGLPASVHRAIAERYGLAVTERYGMTEVGIVVSNRVGDPRPGAIGWPLPGVEVRIVDPSDRDVAPGEVGELWIRAPSAFDGYHRLPEATAQAITADGYVRTGDLGARGADGLITLAGRRSELILVGGFNVYPAEIEAVLLGQPGVREAAVVGVADADLGEVPVAAVVLDEGVDRSSLHAALRAELAPYKIPRVLHPVDALPRNPMGKVVRSAVAEALAAAGVAATPRPPPRGRSA